MLVLSIIFSSPEKCHFRGLQKKIVWDATSFLNFFQKANLCQDNGLNSVKGSSTKMHGKVFMFFTRSTNNVVEENIFSSK